MKRLAIAAAAWLIGCAPIASLAPTHLDRQISSRTVERVRDEGIVGRATQDGTLLHVSASRACDLVEQHRVDRTTRVEHKNGAKWLDASLGVAALAAIGTGTLLMIDSSNVHEDDKTGRTYNPTGPSKAFAYGVATTAGGVALLSIPIFDMVRAHRVTEKTDEVTLNGEVTQASIACSNKPASNTEVSLSIAGSLVGVGATDAEGNARIDLLAALHADLAPQLLGGEVPVVLGASRVGSFTLEPVYDAREQRAWRAVNVPSCQKPSEPSSCDSMRAFMNKWTQGEHFAEASALLVASGPEISRLTDERFWARTDVKACAAPSDDVNAVEQACRAIERGYLAALPTGAHSNEARNVVEKGLARAAEVRDRLQKQAAREAEHEQRRAEVDAIKACRSRCKMGCSSWRIRDEGMCLVGCLEQCGGE